LLSNRKRYCPFRQPGGGGGQYHSREGHHGNQRVWNLGHFLNLWCKSDVNVGRRRRAHPFLTYRLLMYSDALFEEFHIYHVECMVTSRPMGIFYVQRNYWEHVSRPHPPRSLCLLPYWHVTSITATRSVNELSYVKRQNFLIVHYTRCYSKRSTTAGWWWLETKVITTTAVLLGRNNATLCQRWQLKTMQALCSQSVLAVQPVRRVWTFALYTKTHTDTHTKQQNNQW